MTRARIAKLVFICALIVGVIVKLTVPMTPNEFLMNMWPDIAVGIIALIYIVRYEKLL